MRSAADGEPDLQRLLTALALGDESASAHAAETIAALAADRPEVLQPFAERLIRAAGTTEHDSARAHLARALPRLELGARRAGRLAFVYESWLDGSDPELQRAALDALLALVPQRPALADRLRSQIESRTARGAPAIARHGRGILERLRAF